MGQLPSFEGCSGRDHVAAAYQALHDTEYACSVVVQDAIDAGLDEFDRIALVAHLDMVRVRIYETLMKLGVYKDE